MKLAKEYCDILLSLKDATSKGDYAASLADAKSKVNEVTKKYLDLAQRKKQLLFRQADIGFDNDKKRLEKMNNLAVMLIELLTDPTDETAWELAVNTLNSINSEED